MIIKEADDKTPQIATLEALSARRDAGPDVRKRIEREIRNIRAGIKGEAEAAHEIDFHFGSAKNYVVIHDLRLECEGRVAQIDHLLIGRFLDIWVCESKHFSEGIAINEQGECSAFFRNKPYGVASPFEQNRKHVMVLESLFASGMVPLPTRLGIQIKPRMNSVVLVSKGARISRPKATIAGLENIVKNDQFRSFIDRAVDGDNNPLGIVKLIGADTLESLGRAIAAQHQPIEFRWAARFGLSEEPLEALPVRGGRSTASVEPPPLPSQGRMEDRAPAAKGEVKPKQKLVCGKCAEPVAYNVARFCWFNKARFGGVVYCMECQKAV